MSKNKVARKEPMSITINTDTGLDKVCTLLDLRNNFLALLEWLDDRIKTQTRAIDSRRPTDSLYDFHVTSRNEARCIYAKVLSLAPSRLEIPKHEDRISDCCSASLIYDEGTPNDVAMCAQCKEWCGVTHPE